MEATLQKRITGSTRPLETFQWHFAPVQCSFNPAPLLNQLPAISQIQEVTTTTGIVVRTRGTYFIGAGFHLLHRWIHVNILKVDATANCTGIMLLRNYLHKNNRRLQNKIRSSNFQTLNHSQSNPSLWESMKPFSIFKKAQIFAPSNDIPQGPPLLCHFPEGHCHHLARKATWNHELFGDYESMQGMPAKLHDSATILAVAEPGTEALCTSDH